MRAGLSFVLDNVGRLTVLALTVAVAGLPIFLLVAVVARGIGGPAADLGFLIGGLTLAGWAVLLPVVVLVFVKTKLFADPSRPKL